MITALRIAPVPSLLVNLLLSTLPAYPQEKVPYDSLRIVLEKVYDSDQGIRKKLMASSGTGFGKLVRQMQEIDSLNRYQVTAILEEYGWLSKSKIGEKASDAIFYAVQHAEPDLMKAHLPELKKLARRKEAKATHAAMMEDRILMYEGKKQKYGTQATSTGPDNRSVIWPVEKPRKVNKLRRKAGFELTVEENAKRLDAVYNPDEKLPDVKMNRAP